MIQRITLELTTADGDFAEFVVDATDRIVIDIDPSWIADSLVTSTGRELCQKTDNQN